MNTKKPRQFRIDAHLDDVIQNLNGAAIARRAIHKAALLQDPSTLIVAPLPGRDRRTSFNINDADLATIGKLACALNLSQNTAFNLILRHYLQDPARQELNI